MKKRNWAIIASVVTFASGIGLVSTGGWLISEAALRPPLLVLQVAIVSVRAFGIMRGSFRWVERVVSHDAALAETVERRAALWEGLASAGPRGAWSFRQGDTVTRLMQDAEILQDRVTRVVVPATAAIITALGAVSVQSVLQPTAGLLFLVAVLLAGGMVPLVLRAIERSAAERALLERGVLNSTIAEYALHRDEFRLLGLVDETVATIEAIDERRIGIEIRAARLAGFTQLLALLSSGFGLVAGLIVAIPAVTDGSLQGPHLAVVALLPWSASEVIAALASAATAHVRVQAAQQRLTEISQVEQKIPVLEHAEQLTLRDVHVSWTDSEVVEHISLSVARGERVALVGPSGSGKSTIAAAVLGLVDYRGEIAAPSASADRTASVAAVLQSTHTFDTTVRENLRLAVDADDARLVDVLRTVGLVLPLDRDLGRQPLSGGERQRLGLARALLTDAPFLVLDEPTEHLDDETAERVMEVILAATRDRGLLMTSHRLTELTGFERIHVLDAGRIVAVGSFDDCLRENAWFRDSVQWHLDKRQVS